MIEISRGRASEYDEIIDFIDYVFSKSNFPHDFPAMYPNLYRPTDESMNNLVNLREDGVIKASVLCYPRTLSAAGRELKIYGIGSVASHPRARGRGFMTMLMERCIADMEHEGVHLSNLGGSRSRYNNYGYEIAGNMYGTSFSPDNIRKARPDFDAASYDFPRVSQDDKILPELHGIYLAKPVHYVYDEDDFYLRMIPRGGAAPYAVFKDGTLLGYIAAGGPGKDTEIREICLSDDSLAPEALMAFSVKTGMSLRYPFAQWQLAHLRSVLEIAGEIQLYGRSMWKVMDWPGTLSALLALKARYANLEPGRLVVDIAPTRGFAGGRFAVEYDGKTAGAEKTGASPDVELDYFRAIRGFFGPCPLSVFGMDAPREILSLVNSWLPLPLHWFGTESV